MATGMAPAPIGQLFIPYGQATSSGLTITIPGSGENYLLFTANNNSAAVTLWFVRPTRSVAIKLFGGSAITVSADSSRHVTVTSTGYTVAVFVAEIG